jgi:hypothetical protein
MASKFIDLNRSFIPVSRDYSVSDEEHDYSALFGMAGDKKWNDLLQLPRVIILAEAGAGKTAELRAVVRTLRSEKKPAFFVPLEYLAASSELLFESGCGSKAEFDKWMLSDEPAWFFLDSVDEAKLGDSTKFDLAIQRFAQQLRPNIDRVHLYITSRVSEWYAQHDLNLVEACFTPERKEIEPDVSENSFEKESFKAKIFTIAPLSSEQIRTFASEWGVRDVNILLTEIDHSETDIFCRHPEDLIEVIDYWLSHGKISSRSELLDHRIALKLKESSSKRGRAFPLSAEKAVEGVELIAASVTLQRRSRILLPDNEPDRNLRSLAIDPHDALSGWGENEIGALLQRSIFDPAVYGTVRFHHRAAREYLTARWFKRLLDGGKSRRKVNALFFAERHGEQIAVPSMRSILAWLVLLDDQFRSKTAEIAPEVFLQGGDPSSLPVAERDKLLRIFCENMSGNAWQWHSFDWSDVRRFAHRDLACTINELLKKHCGNEEICRLLLRMIFQKQIAASADAALKFVLDDGVGRRLKSYAIWAIGGAGSKNHKEQIRRWIMSKPRILSDDLIGDVIDACCPEVLTVSEAVQLLSRIKNRPEFSHKSIDRELETFVSEKCPIDQLLPLVKGFLDLLKKKPVVEKHSMPYSKQYEWLLPFAALAAERLIRGKHPDAFNKNVLSAVMLAAANRRYSYVLREGKLVEVIPAWKEFNQALFWHQVNMHRRHSRKKQIRVKDFWQMRIHQEYWQFDMSDFEIVLGDIQTRKNRDNRLIAVSLAFDIYSRGGRRRKDRERLKKTVAGDAELEQALNELLHPPTRPDEFRKDRRRHAAQRQRWKKQNADWKTRRIEWLNENPDVLRDASIAKEGKVYAGMMWVRDFVNEQVLVDSRRSHDRWSAPEWKSVVGLLGYEVAEAYRDGCAGYWRHYIPDVKSEGLSSEGTPQALIIGLSGLDIESSEYPDWPNGLSELEARIAARYAVNEMNGFPEWLPRLHKRFPDVVKERLLDEIEWEFSCPQDGPAPYYVLDDIKYHWKEIVPVIGEDIFGMLENHEPHFSVTRNVIELISASGSLGQDLIASLARRRFEGASEAVERAFWMAMWFRTDADEALRYLEGILQNSPRGKSVEFMMNLALQLAGRNGEPVNSAYVDYIRVEILSRLVGLMYEYVRLADDNIHEAGGTYSPDFRDHAGEARSGLFSQPCTISGKATYLALLHISKTHPESDLRPICRRQAKIRAETDSEIDPWSTHDISEFAREAECAPKNHRDLFELIVSRLSDLKLDLEDGDSSIAGILIKESAEVEHRKFIGGWLREHSHGRYVAPQEEELADGKKPDIRIHIPSIDGAVPIELKIADNWTATVLAERLENQLCGQYLRDARSNCGVFLLVYRGEKKCWQRPKSQKQVAFDGLVDLLKKEAQRILGANSKIEAIEIVGIDLSKRMKRAHLR